MSITLAPNANGTSGELQIGGAARLTLNADGTVSAAASPSVTDDSTKIATTALVRDLTVGIDQTWQDVTSLRASGTTYYNTSGKAICLLIGATLGSSGASAVLAVGGVAVITVNGTSVKPPLFCVVPPGAAYSLTLTNTTLVSWQELK